MRTLTLRGGLSYTVGNLCFRKDEPKPVQDDSLFYRLIHTGTFEEDPPLCYYYIRRKKNPAIRHNKTVRVDGRWLMISDDNPVRISRYQWSKISPSGQFEIVPPCEVMDKLVEEGKEDFSLLVIRDMGAGDVIITTDLVYNLRLRYPKAKIAYATSERYVCLIENLDFIDEVITIGSKNPADYDVSVNLCGWSEQYPICAKIHRSDLFGMAFSDNFDWKDHRICLKLHEEEQVWFEEFNKTHNPDCRPVVAVQPYGSSGHRSLDPIAVNRTVDWLISEGYFVIVYGEKQWPNLFHSRPNMVCLWSAVTIRQVITIIANSKLLICPDSSGYHIAAAFDTPSIAVFTTIHEGVRVTYYPRCYPIRTNELNCSPCWDRPCGLPEASDCIRKITGARIIEKVSEVISQGFPYIEHPSYNPPDWD
ncbi:MAG: glycosyltransferase family 9 protein [Candidatus Izemoplasmatales bacterium]|jgi:ADP-heptose:LPS heptosyltransferase